MATAPRIRIEEHRAIPHPESEWESALPGLVLSWDRAEPAESVRRAVLSRLRWFVVGLTGTAVLLAAIAVWRAVVDGLAGIVTAVVLGAVSLVALRCAMSLRRTWRYLVNAPPRPEQLVLTDRWMSYDTGKAWPKLIENGLGAAHDSQLRPLPVVERERFLESADDDEGWRYLFLTASEPGDVVAELCLRPDRLVFAMGHCGDDGDTLTFDNHPAIAVDLTNDDRKALFTLLETWATTGIDATMRLGHEPESVARSAKPRA